jgi:calcium/calmodulin-dependent protein kinase I
MMKFNNINFTDLTFLIINDIYFCKEYMLINIIKKYKNKISAKVKSLKDGNFYFLKVKLKNKITEYEKDIYNFLKKNKHEYIENIINIFESGCLLYIVSEFIDGKNLSELKKLICKEELNNIMKMTFEGVSYLHKNNIIHCDIKLDNIMYKNDKIIIVDFDFAKILKNSDSICENNIIGTENYIAPESFDLKIYSKKSDIWSLGICFYKLITKKFPYKSEQSQIYNMYIKNCFKNLDLDIINKYENTYGTNIINSINIMLKFNDNSRLNAKEILNLLN